MCRRSSSTKRSTIRMSAADVRMTTSGNTASRFSANAMSELRLRDVREQVRNGNMHHVDERLGPYTHRENRQRDQREQPEFASIEIGHRCDAAVRHRTENDALVHPQRVSGAKDHDRCCEKTEPEVHFDRRQDYEKLADEPRRRRQT